MSTLTGTAGHAVGALQFFLVAMGLSLAIIPVMRAHAATLGLLDRPAARKLHNTPMARVGGVGIAGGALTALLLALPMDRLVQGYLLGSLVILVFGVADDRSELGYRAKFVGQFLAAGIMVFWGGLFVERLPFFGDAELPGIIAVPFTLLVTVGVINAVNHSDGLDGLAGGESLLSLGGMALLAYWSGDPTALLISMAVLGGLLGFMRFNSHPASVFMGDTGSQFLGFTVAFLAILLTQRSNHALSPAVVALLIGLPVADILSVLYLRMKNRMHWFNASRNHLHHRLLGLGFAHSEGVIILYLLQALLVVSAVILRYHEDALIVVAYLAVVATAFLLVSRAERTGWQVRSSTSSSPGRGAQEQLRWVSALPDHLVLLVAVAYLGAKGFSCVCFGPGLLATAIALAAVVAVSATWPSVRALLPSRVAAYAGVILLTYLHGQDGALGSLPEAVPLGILAALLVLAVSMNATRFRLTPMDALVGLILVLLVLVGDHLHLERQWINLAVKIAIVLYATEYLMQRGGLHTVALLACIAGSLALATIGPHC